MDSSGDGRLSLDELKEGLKEIKDDVRKIHARIDGLQDTYVHKSTCDRTHSK